MLKFVQLVGRFLRQSRAGKVCEGSMVLQGGLPGHVAVALKVAGRVEHENSGK